MVPTAQERQYERTHPWLTFHVGLDRLNHLDWMRMGEVVSKCQHVAGVPLKPAVQAELLSMFISKGAHGTVAIEGNTLSEDEVLQRMAGDLELAESQEYMGQEIDNMLDAYNTITHAAFDADDDDLGPLTVDLVKKYHRRILRNQPLKDGVVPGAFRTGSVTVGGVYRGAPAEDCEFLMQRMIDWLEGSDFELEVHGASAPYVLPVKILRAMLAHLYIAWIHPFGDGNGRVARLIEFRYLVQAGLPLPACHLLSSHYNRTRTAYYGRLQETSRSAPFPWEAFVSYALQGFQEQLRESLSLVRQSQMAVTWENYVHDRFREHETETGRRQRKVALDLPADRATPKGEIRRVSVRVAEAYGGKTDKTVSRDVNQLVKLGLIRREKSGYWPARDLVEAFLAPRTTNADGHNVLGI